MPQATNGPISVTHLIRMSAFGGGTVAPIRLAAEERRAGRDVRIFAMVAAQFDKVSRTAAEEGLHVRRLNAAGMTLALLAMRARPRRSLFHLHSGLNYLSPNVSRIRKVLGGRVPFVVSLHGSGDLESADAGFAARHLACGHDVDAVLVPSEAQRDVQLSAGISADKVHVLPVVTRVRSGEAGDLRKAIALPADARVVAWCGRLSPEKNPLTLIRAFRVVAQRDARATLVVAGDGPQMTQVRDEAKDLGSRVVLLGHFDDVASLYADAEVLVAPSFNESFGMTAVEAAMAGCPVILSRIRPWSDMFQSDADCLFISPADEWDVAQAVLRMLDDPARARVMADRARRRAVAEYSGDRSVSIAADVYRTASLGRINRDNSSNARQNKPRRATDGRSGVVSPHSGD